MVHLVPPRRVLVVEDEALLAMDLEMVLRGAGYAVVGPVARIGPALAIVEREPLVAALLDVNLAGEPAYPIADALAARDIPFLFLTGYEPDSLPERFHGRLIGRKPYAAGRLLILLSALLP